MHSLSIIGVVALVGCGSNEVLVELENQGTACLYGAEFAGPSPEGRTFPADRTVEIQIRHMDVCLSGSCTRDLAGSCEVSLVGQTLSIATHASWIDEDPDGERTCTQDCTFAPGATCVTPPLPAGSYTFELAGRSLAVTIPTTVTATPCIP